MNTNLSSKDMLELAISKHKKQDLSGLTIKYMLSNQSLTRYQKSSLLLRHYKYYQLFTLIPYKAIQLFLSNSKAYIAKKNI